MVSRRLRHDNAPRRRLLLTNYDLGVEVPTKTLQLGLNFAEQLPELFTGREMGEDALRVLDDYLKFYARIPFDIKAELPMVRAAARWGAQFLNEIKVFLG